jgi:tetratricopeptide (TPR) repeat protein
MGPKLALTVLCCFLPLAAGADEPARRDVFRQPLVVAAYGRLQMQTHKLFKKKQYADAARQCLEAIKLAPQYPDAYYNLACALARQDRKQEALDNLARAIDHGFNQAKLMRQDADLKSLRSDERFAKLLARAEKTKPILRWPADVKPGPVKDGTALVTEQDTTFDVRANVLRTFFELPKPDRMKEVVKGFGEAGDLLRKWFKDGTAAGHFGDIYDNHDGDHSSLSWQSFPQLTRTRYSKEAQALHLHNGLQHAFLFNGVVLGNSSTAIVSQPYWRSQTRFAYTQPRFIAALARQYAENHLYFYPEHRDHDPGHNGKGDGYGDVYPANTPYVITSQGSSGSDQVFLNAVGFTLAAFRPEVKRFLADNGALMPTVQLIFRSSNKNVKTANDYLTGAAHPSVFEGGNVDVLRMVKMAHDIPRDAVPPLMQLRVVKEDKPVLGVDYFDAEARGEHQFDTPAAIARVLRSTRYIRRLVVSAEDSRDLNKRPLTWRWVVLRGDATIIRIKPLNKERSVAELTVAYFERRPIQPGAKMESNRVDVGVFVHNGKYYSAPAFVTFFSLDNQKRTYGEGQRLVSVDYADKEVGNNYVDPLVDMKKDWRDVYHYDTQGRLTGWTRHRGDKTEEFTAAGALVLTRDKQGRPLTARTVRYVPKNRPGQAPLLEQQAGDKVLHYEYASDKDRIGRIKE